MNRWREVPLSEERIGEWLQNPQYSEMGIFQRLQKVLSRGGEGATVVKKMLGSPSCALRDFGEAGLSDP